MKLFMEHPKYVYRYQYQQATGIPAPGLGFFVIPSRAGITNLTGIIDRDFLIEQNVILGILLIFTVN